VEFPLIESICVPAGSLLLLINVEAEIEERFKAQVEA